MSVLVTKCIRSEVTFSYVGVGGGIWYGGGRTIAIEPESVTRWGRLYEYNSFVARRIVYINDDTPHIVESAKRQDPDVYTALQRVYRKFRGIPLSCGTSREVPQIIQYAQPAPTFFELWQRAIGRAA